MPFFWLFGLLITVLALGFGAVIGIIGLIFTRKIFYGQLLAVVLAAAFGMMALLLGIRLLSNKRRLGQEDFYGTYIIDRTKFPGKQADWQYDHFRFEVTKEDSFLFHLTDKARILKTYKGKVSFLAAYKRSRMVIHVDTPTYHIIEQQPTLYRERFSFYYVFESRKFGNVFFTKGDWEPLDN